MRRWIAVLAGCAALVISGVAFGLTDGPSRSDEVTKPEAAAPGTTKPVEHREIDTESRDEKPKADKVESSYDEPDKVYPIEPAPEPDTTPPGLVILHPKQEQVFESKKVVFEGTTEPGASVHAGEYQADVSKDGAWRIVLYLSPGSNRVTFKAVDEAGNVSEASVTVSLRVETPDKPKEEKPEEEKPDKPEQGEWEFAAHQVYGECSENPPYDVFHGKGKPGSVIEVISEFGSGSTEVNEHGEWELRVYFEGSPVGQAILVKVRDEFGHKQMFEFVHTEPESV